MQFFSYAKMGSTPLPEIPFGDGLDFPAGGIGKDGVAHVQAVQRPLLLEASARKIDERRKQIDDVHHAVVGGTG